MTTEAKTRREILESRLKESRWEAMVPTHIALKSSIFRDSQNILRENPAPEIRKFGDSVLLGENGKPFSVEAKRFSKDAEIGREQAKQQATELCYEATF